MQFNVAVLSGDGVGPEVTGEAVKVLLAAGKKYGHVFKLDYGLLGGVAKDLRPTIRRDPRAGLSR